MAKNNELITLTEITYIYEIDEYTARRLAKKPGFPQPVSELRKKQARIKGNGIFFEQSEIINFMADHSPVMRFNLMATRFIRGEFDTEATRNKYQGKRKKPRTLRRAA